MKKIITLFAVAMLLASVSFAQGTARRGQKMDPTKVSPMAAFKAQQKKKAVKAAGDTISTFPWTEGFENGLPSGFTLIDNDNDGYNWAVFTVTGDNFSTHSGDACIASASYDNDEGALTPDNWMILPVFEIPSDLSDATLTWYEKGQDPNYAAENYSVYITTTGHAISNFTATTAVYTGTATGDWVKRTVNLSSYAGQTIHIAFRHHNITDMFYLNIDDIRIGGPEMPVVSVYGPTSVPSGVPATFTAIYSGATSVAWYVDGSMSTAANDTLTYTFTTTGLHQVVATATNAIGSTSDTLEVDVFSCDGITIPYAPDFTEGLGCWVSRSDSTENSGWFASVDMFEDEAIGQVLSMSAQSVWGMFMMDFPVDNWLFSPVVEMPTTGSYELAWKVAPYNSSYDGDHYGVYVISGTDTTLLYEESLTGMTDFTQRMAIIPSSISGDFKVAFRHFDCAGGFVIILDSIQLRSLSAPVLTINGPSSIENGTPATFVANSPNATSFSWTINGNASTETSNTLTTTFTTDGNYTIAVTATNSVGSANASTTVEVYSCETITTFPYTMDFENGIRCWQTISMDPANDDKFTLIENPEYAYEGNAAFMFSSYSSATDYNQYLISPELTLPSGNYMMTFQYKGQTAGESFRILASTTNNELSSFNVIADYPATETEWTMAAGMLPAGTKYVAIDYYGNYQYYLYIDNIVIDVLNAAPTVTVEGPASAMTGEDVTFTASAPLATSFSWAVDGTAVNETSNTLTTSFTTGGEHTVTVTATNTIGSNSATATISIISCDAITQFPWSVNFEDSDLSCWFVIDADADGNNWFPISGTSQSGEGYGHNSEGVIASASYDNNSGVLTPDNWLILPAMTMPAGSSLSLSWFDKGMDSNYASENYSVYVSTTDRNIESFTNQLFTGVSTDQWLSHNASLAQFAGQTIYIAFRHHDVSDQYILLIDDITVSGQGVGIDNVENGNFSIFPNPATNMVNINVEGVEGSVNIQIVDVNGRVVKEMSSESQNITIDVTNMTRGAYFVRMNGENVNAVRKLIVK